uniref:Uncharacterized protein n=1 Tax=Nosema bombycis TaxID=27978 RepID=A5JEL0_NOSBO|nr:unknown [Nosema bombycis]
MVNLNEIETIESYEKIAKLEGDEYNQYKVIALINLDKFKEALKFVQPGSFEAAYIYYKLKNYKKALKIISKFKDEKSFILKSQILYSIGFYNKAYEILRNMR